MAAVRIPMSAFNAAVKLPPGETQHWGMVGDTIANHPELEGHDTGWGAVGEGSGQESEQPT